MRVLDASNAASSGNRSKDISGSAIKKIVQAIAPIQTSHNVQIEDFIDPLSIVTPGVFRWVSDDTHALAADGFNQIRRSYIKPRDQPKGEHEPPGF